MSHEIRIRAEVQGYSLQDRQSEKHILKALSFQARKGEFIGLVGPNGAGKTTLLKILGGLIMPRGTVEIGGEETPLQQIRQYSSQELAQIVCYMHQDTVVPFPYTVREIVSMGRQPWLTRFSSLSKADQKVVDEAFLLTGCRELADRCIMELSGGERQRVMLARALAQETSILLLDEPTASLDLLYATQVFQLCRKLAQDGRCIVAVFHDLRQAAQVCTRLCLMANGTVIADGDPRRVLTEKNIAKAYNVQAHVFENPIGQWDYYIPQDF